MLQSGMIPKLFFLKLNKRNAPAVAVEAGEMTAFKDGGMRAHDSVLCSPPASREGITINLIIRVKYVSGVG